jgi:hypothetical protein
MPVVKFRSFEEAREALWGEPGDAEHLRRVSWLWAFSDRLYPRRFPHGVYRFASIEEANAQRDAWEGAPSSPTPEQRPPS